MKDNREKGQSRLDYLWVNYGEYSVSTTPNDNPDVLLTQSAINSIFKLLKSVTSVKVVDSILYVEMTDGSIYKYLLPSEVANFSKRQIILSDIDKGCLFPLNTWCYSIVLSNGDEYLTPLEYTKEEIDTKLENYMTKEDFDSFVEHQEIEVTYAQAVDLVNTALINPMCSYIITDWQCIYNINELVKDGDIIVSPNIYKLRLYPKGRDAFEEDIEFVDYPLWKAKYRLEYKGEYMWETPTQKGWIYYYENENHIKSEFFFREIKVRKFKITEFSQIPDFVGKYFGYYPGTSGYSLPDKDGNLVAWKLDPNDYRDYYVFEDKNGYAGDNSVFAGITILCSNLNYGFTRGTNIKGSITCFVTDISAEDAFQVQSSAAPIPNAIFCVWDSTLAHSIVPRGGLYADNTDRIAYTGSATGCMIINSYCSGGFHNLTGFVLYDSRISGVDYVALSIILHCLFYSTNSINEIQTCYLDNYIFDYNKINAIILSLIIGNIDNTTEMYSCVIGSILYCHITSSSIYDCAFSSINGSSDKLLNVSSRLFNFKASRIFYTDLVAPKIYNVDSKTFMILNVVLPSSNINNTVIISQMSNLGILNLDLSSLDLSEEKYKALVINLNGDTKLIYLEDLQDSITQNINDLEEFKNSVLETLTTLLESISNESNERQTQDTVLNSLITAEGENRTQAINQLNTQLTSLINAKQDQLVSGTNIKTINNESLLGSGNITIDLTLFVVVSQLPTQDINPNKIYLVPSVETTEQNEYTEYIYNDGTWEELGKYKSDVDLTPYLTKEDAANTYATKESLAEVATSGSYNDLTDKPSPYSLPIANSTTLGGVKSSTTGTTSGRDYLVEVNSNGTMKVNVPWINTTYQVVTDSANGLMSSTDKAKLDNFGKVNEMSTTGEVTQEIQPNQFYEFGEVTSLTITLASQTSGYIGEYQFQFTSGSTPTTLNLPEDVSYMVAPDFQIEANKTYQVSILNNVAVIGGY